MKTSPRHHMKYLSFHGLIIYKNPVFVNRINLRPFRPPAFIFIDRNHLEKAAPLIKIMFQICCKSAGFMIKLLSKDF